MHIVGIGVDIVDVRRMERLLTRHGDRFPRRILGSQEHEEFARAANPPAFLAKRFAAKEAVSKAMGTGFRDGMFLADIAVDHDELGRPLVALGGVAAIRARERGITEWHLSLADEHHMAIAYVTAVGDA